MDKSRLAMRAVVCSRCLAAEVSLAMSVLQAESSVQEPLVSVVAGQRLRWISVPASVWHNWQRLESVIPALCSLVCGQCPFDAADLRLDLHLLVHLLCS